MMLHPDTKIHQISFFDLTGEHKDASSIKLSFSNNTQPSLGDGLQGVKNSENYLFVVRDDLLHPFVNGNKARKLDALLPLLQAHGVTDVVTCGGCQSAHATALAVSCAERGLRCHLLLRGEQPETQTGYNLLSGMYGGVTYVPRSLYANREEMLNRHAYKVAGSHGSVVSLDDMLDSSLLLPSRQMNVASLGNDSRHQSASKGSTRKVVIVKEGAGDAIALLGVMRLVDYLSQTQIFGRSHSLKIVVDAGTGTTAVGLALGVLCLGLPWEVTGIMLANTIEGYRKQEARLISDFKRFCGWDIDYASNGAGSNCVQWVERISPRKFGNTLEGELEACQQIARQTGILVDPVYTLAAWQHATAFCQSLRENDNAKVVMLHTGGTLGLFGLAQRYKNYFHGLQQSNHG
ncbi:hypothetical protein AMTRI_Chr02g265280 [Amborella trichopoda]|nr:D-cysteine desulfhydrase 2, mitochondrial isoform X2 [Amborella trichopoda]|eukprot:XP_020520607.1 D-cysteine desulfhydrase 2, mitochondrial isoform X2 [Amborella trichopoda]